MKSQTDSLFPSNFHVLERGWLSSNSLVVLGEHGAGIVDTGYVSHAPQTLSLVEALLGGKPLLQLVNTHLHSDHCGGNATLRRRWPKAVRHIPPGHAGFVSVWDERALTYTPTGQSCERFGFDATLQAGGSLDIGGSAFEVHAAPGHDPHSVVLFHRASATLLSADALWENGFGVVFPALDGENAFGEVAETLDLIESLQAATVIPGHGRPFVDVPKALAAARQRLAHFTANPDKHAAHGVKVLIKYHMLEVQRQSVEELEAWLARTSYFAQVHGLFGGASSLQNYMANALDGLVKTGALGLADNVVFNKD